ncbi:pectin lyase fold/virulence factor [Elsinoe ampelina]|uniref:Pectinesterase n=1 Tax=Elsinoe ampelina TaxID=302913 RepID=A0A6A6GCB0_9PEZI|nr:pectin lyase fold/virulence factor [Elsinoe ampelina]
MLKSIAFLLTNVALALAAAKTTAPSGALVVGGSGKYKTVQAAVNALSKTSTSTQTIFINPGTYKEQVYIQALKGPLTIQGYTSNDASYTNNQVTITQGKSQDDSANNDLTATLRAWTTNLKVYNVNLVNTRGQGSQALALSASANNQGYYACQFLGFQDTILAQTGNQIYAKSLIQGATDFIFGQYATAWFSQCDIRVLKASTGYITASGRLDANNPNWYVFDKCNVAAASGNSVPNGAYYLGRPWREFARVTFQNTALSAVVNGAGWVQWNSGDPRTSSVTFQEYGNTGTGASGTRAKFSKKISAAIPITQILGSGYASAAYVDKAFL